MIDVFVVIYLTYFFVAVFSLWSAISSLLFAGARFDH